MHFEYAILVPANTAQASPLVTTLPLAAGVITAVDIQFPPGPAALVHVALRRALHQVYPLNPEQDYASDDETIHIDDALELSTAPYQLEAYAWSADDTYPHTVYVRINVLPLDILRRPDPALGILARIARSLGVR